MTELLFNNPTPAVSAPHAITTLSAEVTAIATKIKVNAAAPESLWNGTFRIVLGEEYLTVTAGQNTTEWTVLRAQESSTGAIHANTTSVIPVLTAAAVQALFTPLVSMTAENVEHTKLVKVPSTSGLAVGMVVQGRFGEESDVGWNNRIAVILSSTEFELERIAKGNGVVTVATPSKSKILKVVKTAAEKLVVGMPVADAKHRVPPGTTLVKIGTIAEPTELELSAEMTAGPVEEDNFFFYRNLTFTIYVASPATTGGANFGHEWQPAEAPWTWALGSLPTEAHGASPLKASWIPPVAKHIWYQDAHDNFAMGPAWPLIEPGENGTLGSTVNIAIGGIGGGGWGAGRGGAMENLTATSCNIAIGMSALYFMTTPTETGEQEAGNNIAIGNGAQEWGNTSNNVVVGVEANRYNTSATASENNLHGYGVMKFAVGQGKHVAMGHQAGRDGIETSAQVLLGHEAGKTVEGEKNVAIGYRALFAPPTFTLAGCEFTAGSKVVKVASTASLKVGMIFFTATGQFSDERVFPREGFLWYLSAIKGAEEFEVQRHHVPNPWKSGKKYNVGETVWMASGTTYNCVTTNTAEAANEPPNTAFWRTWATGPNPVPEKTETLTLTFVPKYTDSSTVAIGAEAMGKAAYTNATPTTQGTIAIGFQSALEIKGANNIVIGREAGKKITEENNIVIGREAGGKITNSNVIIGHQAGKSASLTQLNILLGFKAGETVTGENNLWIGEKGIIKGVMPEVNLQFNATEMGFFKHAVAAQPAAITEPAETTAGNTKAIKELLTALKSIGLTA